jgi:hypothetical protein
MSKLTITIANEAGGTLGQYEIAGSDSPTEAEELRRTGYLLNQIRIAAEVHKYHGDFAEPDQLHQISVPFQVNFDDPTQGMRGENVNALWLEIGNLLRGARLNFSQSRVMKQIEMEYGADTPEAINTKYDLHFDKMELFYLAVFELARIEDLTVRLLFEYFGDAFIVVDRAKKDWEKSLTWAAMKYALNARGKPEKQPCPPVDAMSDDVYNDLMQIIRGYKSPKVLALTEFRDRRTHRVTPSVDYPELGAVLSTAVESGGAIMIPVGVTRTKAEYEYFDLYETAKDVYKQLSEMLAALNKIIHA